MNNKNKLAIAVVVGLTGIFGLSLPARAENKDFSAEATNIDQSEVIASFQKEQKIIDLEEKAERLRSATVQKLIKESNQSQSLITRDSHGVQKKTLDKKQFDDSLVRFRAARDDFNKNKGDAAKQKEALLKLVNGLKSRATLLGKRVDTLPVVSQELQASLSSEAQAETAKFDEVESRIQAANNSETLKALTVELRNRRDATGQKSRLLVLLAYLGAEENYYLKTAQAQIAAVATGIQKFKTDGKDTSSLDSMLTGAQAKSLEVQQKINDAKAAIGAEAITDARFRELHGVLQGINDEIAAIYGLLQQIVQGAKNL